MNQLKKDPLEKMIDKALEELKNQGNFKNVKLALGTLGSDLVIEGKNRYQECYDYLVELGEQEIADKYIKPLI